MLYVTVCFIFPYYVNHFSKWVSPFPNSEFKFNLNLNRNEIFKVTLCECTVLVKCLE